MNEELRRDIDRFVEENTENLIRDIARLVSVNSVEGEPEPGAPFGRGPREALDTALQIARELGLETVDCEGMIGYAALGEGDRYLATVTHVDVVPAGEGWSADPFALREREGYLIGRGVTDDKGPSVLCLYALKYLRERNIPLRYPVRALLGVNEETRMDDVKYYLKRYPAPLFCFSPDANFPLCNGEKGICHGRIVSRHPSEDILEIQGGTVVNAVPARAEALVRAKALSPTERVKAELVGEELWKLTAHGIGGHASTPEDTVNAVGILVEYLLENGVGSGDERAFLSLLKRLHGNTDGSGVGAAADDGLFQPLTIIGSVIGMEDGRLFQAFDCRYPTNMSGEKLKAALERQAGELAQIVIDNDKPPFYLSVDNPAVQICLEAYNTITGENAQAYTIGGGTYARLFPNAVSFGPEHPERPQPAFAGPIHGADEAAGKSELLEALKIYILALLELEKLSF